MKRLLTASALIAGLHPGLSGAQDPANSPHAGHAAKPAASVKAPERPTAKSDAGEGYRSPFADYRAFVPEQPRKSWRAANEEVGRAGGHLGLSKGVPRGDADDSKDGKR